MNRRRRYWEAGLVGIAALAALTLPLLNLTGSLWSDEASSVWFARQPVVHLIGQLCDPHPPGYYLLLKAWMALSESEPWLRALSLLAALAAVLLTYRLGREVGGAAVGIGSALLLALHPLQNWYAAEVRMYALAQVLGLAVMGLGWRTLHKWTRWRAAAYVLTVLAAVWVDYTTLLPWGLLQWIWLSRQPSGRWSPAAWRWLALQAVALLPFALWWLASSQRLALADSYQAVFVAVQARALGLEWTPAMAARALVLGLALLSVGMVAAAWSWPRGLRSRISGRVRLGFWLVAWVLILALAATPRLYTFKRLLIVLLPYLAVMGGSLWVRFCSPVDPVCIRAKRPLIQRLVYRCAFAVGPVLLGLGLLLSIYALRTHAREPWREALTEVTRQVAPLQGVPGVIWVDELAVPVVDYYARRQLLADLAWAPVYGRRLPALPTLTPAPGSVLWLFLLESPYRNLYPLFPPAFHMHYALVSEQHDPGLAIYQFQRRVQPLAEWPRPPAPDLAVQWGLLLASPLDTCQRGDS